MPTWTTPATANPVVAGDREGRAPRARPEVDVSVLVPAKDEAENLPIFMEQFAEVAAAGPVRYEVIVIDDGSADATWQVLEALRREYPWLRALRHRARRGIADALRTGYLHARGDVLVFYPADLQFKPEDIPRLVAPILDDAADMVTGFKQGKYEKAFVSRVYNWLSRALFDVPVKDLNSVKAYRREIMHGLPVRPDWHRYMIVIAAAQGFTVREIPVPLYPRHAGKSKFGIGRIPVGVLDMLSVWFELRFGQKPLLAFGMLGAGLFGIGLLAGVAAVVVRLVVGVGYRPVLTLVETCLLLGSVFFATGILGEQIAVQRAELRELRRLVDEMSADRPLDGD
ncbi:MAG: glycosyltransferase family 2 protein [Gemmatimonadaceae bacterium]|jgi:glycosyltransferase involved in cell wall biosynthesis|nr:glycosyltransferase family 2 protein [Gemmatimonadaceae bacterium]